MNRISFVETVAGLSFEDAFNPYSSHCEICDRIDAPQLRKKMLLLALKAAEDVQVEAIWVGRDLGYRGGRRTGLALTDDVHAPNYYDRWAIRGEKPTKGGPVAERTAAYIWQVLSNIEAPIFLWNVFPLHPYNPGTPFTNRPHRAVERRAGEEVLEVLIGLLRPRRILAIGKDAEKSVRRLDPVQRSITVRHPSYGGQKVFQQQVRDLYCNR